MSNTSAEPPEGVGSAGEVSGFSVEPALAPTASEDGASALAGSLTYSFRGRQGFEQRLNVAGAGTTSRSRVFVSICEIGFFGGQWKPFQGAASMQVHNVVPHDDGVVIVRGFIGWNADLNARLSVFVA